MIKCKLGDILDVKRGTTLSGMFYSNKGDKIRLTLGNFDYPMGGFKENDSKDDIYFTGKVRSEFILKKGDIITPLTEQVYGLLGETARIPEGNIYIQSGDIGLVIPNEKYLDNLYAYYLVSSPIVKKQLSAGAQQTKIRHTSPDKIKDCIVWIPDLTYQHKVGKLLDTLNNKIKTNNKINSELESLAKTIYDYWFLQFDFPNEEGKPYKSSGGAMEYNEELKMDIPKGWEVVTVTDIADWISNSQPPKSNFIYTQKDGYIRFIQNRDYDSNAYKTYIPMSKTLNIVNRYDILVDKYGDAGSTRYGIEGTYNVALAKIEPHNTNMREYLRSFLSSKGIYTYLHNACMASTRASLDESVLSYVYMPIPPSNLLEKYEEVIHLFREQILMLKDENDELSSLRDYLLPLLMNGQVEFKDE